MSDQKAPQEFKAPSIFLMLVIGGVLSSVWYMIQKDIGIRFFIPYIFGFFVSIGGILYLSSKIITGKKPFTDCKKIAPDDLANMTRILIFISFSTAFRSPNSTEIVLLVQFILLLVNIIVSVMSIQFIMSNRTRETVIILGLLVIYFWSGFYIYNTNLPLIISSFLISITIITIGLGTYILGHQQDKEDIDYEQVKKLQKTRKTAKELQDKLTESEFAKTISHISDVPLSEAPPPKIAWDVDYDVRKTKENRYFAQQLRQQLETLEKLKNQEPNENDKNLLAIIEQTKKHLDSLKQQITQLEKVKTTHSSALQRTTGHYSSYNDSVGQFQQNAPLTLEKINTLLTQMQTTLQQHKEKLQKQHKDDFDQTMSKLKLELKRLGGE